MLRPFNQYFAPSSYETRVTPRFSESTIRAWHTHCHSLARRLGNESHNEKDILSFSFDRNIGGCIRFEFCAGQKLPARLRITLLRFKKLLRQFKRLLQQFERLLRQFANLLRLRIS